MSRTKILATTALVALGTSCLVATEASARSAASFVHTSGGHATSSRAAIITHPANVSRPANIVRPVRLAHLSSNSVSPVSHGLPQFVPSNTASHGLSHLATTNSTLSNGHPFLANKIAPAPTSNAGVITVLTNQAAADAKDAKAAAAKAKQDREDATADTRAAKSLRAISEGAARKAASEAQRDPRQAEDRRTALNFGLKASEMEIKANAARLDATRQQDKAKVLTNNAKAEAAAANKLANGTSGNGSNGTQQTNGQGGGQTNGQGGGQGNNVPGNGGGFPGHGGGFPGHGGGVGPSNAGITTGTIAGNGTGSNAFPQITGAGYSNSPVAPISNAAPQSTTFKALALVWNADGRWVVRSAAQLDAASANALNACNSQYGNCMASGATVDTAALGCLGVASSATDGRQLFAAMGASLDEVRASLMQQLNASGVTGQVKYSACNA